MSDCIRALLARASPPIAAATTASSRASAPIALSSRSSAPAMPAAASLAVAELVLVGDQVDAGDRRSELAAAIAAGGRAGRRVRGLVAEFEVLGLVGELGRGDRDGGDVGRGPPGSS